jgi:hypothetical protein
MRRQVVLIRHVQKSYAVRVTLLKIRHLPNTIGSLERLLDEIRGGGARLECHTREAAARSHRIADRGGETGNLARDMVLADQHEVRQRDRRLQYGRAGTRHFAIVYAQSKGRARQTAFESCHLRAK